MMEIIYSPILQKKGTVRNMRKATVIIFILLLFSSCGGAEGNSPYSLEPNSSQESGNYITGKQYDLDAEYMAALKESNGSNAEFSDITVEFGNKWKAKMEQYYSLLYEKLDENSQEFLIKSQDNWRKFVKSNEDLEQNIVNQYQGGSMGSLVLSENYIIRYRTRAVELLQKCESLGLIT